MDDLISVPAGFDPIAAAELSLVASLHNVLVDLGDDGVALHIPSRAHPPLVTVATIGEARTVLKQL